MTPEIAQLIAAQHGFAVETHDDCVLVMVPGTLHGQLIVEPIPANCIVSLYRALGY